MTVTYGDIFGCHNWVKEMVAGFAIVDRPTGHMSATKDLMTKIELVINARGPRLAQNGCLLSSRVDVRSE